MVLKMCQNINGRRETYFAIAQIILFRMLHNVMQKTPSEFQNKLFKKNDGT